MSALLLSALAAGSSGQGALYADDVFSTYLYTGNGSTQTINNGIDLAGKGGMVWVKSRSAATDHQVFDTERTATYELITNSTAAQVADADTLTAFSSNGFGLGADATTNANTATYASWTFRRATKFFDVVTYTGNSVAGRQIAHSLGAQAGFVTVKATSATGDWNSYHRSATGDLKLNLADAQTASRAIITAADASTFTVSGAANTNGVSYVAYLWAHDPSADGIIQCGSYVGNGGSGNVINLGWEPQYVMVKCASQGTQYNSWCVFDNMRGVTVNGDDNPLMPNLSDAEAMGVNYAYPYINFGARGFDLDGGSSSQTNESGQTYIYLAIRRPSKPPTSGAQVYNASIASGVVSAGFPVDLHIGATRTGAASNHAMHARLTGGTRELVTSSTEAEATTTGLGFDSMAGLRASLSAGGVNHFFRRAHGFFDVVCDAGTGVAHAIAHNLTKVPELIIRKSRSAATQWEVWHSALAATEKLVLSSNAAKATDATAWNSTLSTATQFTVGTGANVNANAATFVTYLFATLAGISKVGSYTGNGSSQTIDCGFSTGARFVLIKRTDATGDWYVWDTARGIVAANDPHLSLNTAAAEVTTDDSIDPASVGFIVNQNTATNVNVTGASYIFLAIA